MSAKELDALNDLQIPTFFTPKGLATGIKALCQCSEAGARLAAHGNVATVAEGPFSFPPRTRTAPVWCEYEVKAWLRARGFPVPDGRFVTGIDEALQAAHTLGYPLAVKVQVPSLSHKADAGGVVLGVTDEAELTTAYERVITAARRIVGDAEIEGALLEQMAPDGVEMMVGLKTEPGLGAFVVIAAGGVLTDLLDDVIVAPAPLAETEIAPLLRRLRCWPILQGRNGTRPRDIRAFCSLASRISSLGPCLVGAIREVDLNPIIVHDDGKGVTIVDGLAVRADVSSRNRENADTGRPEIVIKQNSPRSGGVDMSSKASVNEARVWDYGRRDSSANLR